jgi:hypothetical protein
MTFTPERESGFTMLEVGRRRARHNARPWTSLLRERALWSGVFLWDGLRVEDHVAGGQSGPLDQEAALTGK